MEAKHSGANRGRSHYVFQSPESGLFSYFTDGENKTQTLGSCPRRWQAQRDGEQKPGVLTPELLLAIGHVPPAYRADCLEAH